MATNHYTPKPNYHNLSGAMRPADDWSPQLYPAAVVSSLLTAIGEHFAKWLAYETWNWTDPRRPQRTVRDMRNVGGALTGLERGFGLAWQAWAQSDGHSTLCAAPGPHYVR